MSLSAARSRVTQAGMYLEANRSDEVEPVLVAAEGFLDNLDPEDRDQEAPLRARIAEIRARLATMLSPENERRISAAKGKIRQARAQIEERYVSGIDDTLRVAGEYLDGVPDEYRAPLLAEIAEVRAQIPAPRAPEPEPARAATVTAEPVARPDFTRASGARDPEPALAQPPAANAQTDGAAQTAAVDEPAADGAQPGGAATAARDEPSDEDMTAMSRARSRISQARTMLETWRTDGVAEVLDEAAGLLSGVPEAFTAPLRADIDTVRADLAGVTLAEDVRRIAEELDRHLSSAEADVTVRPDQTVERLDHVYQRLGDEDVNRVLAAESVTRYRARADHIGAQLSAHVKSDALERARPLLAELEERTAADPFAGLDQRAAYLVTGELRTLKDRVLAALHAVPEGDPDVAVAMARLADIDRAVEAASAAWGKAELDAEVARGWTAIAADIAGWEDESDADAAPLAEPRLPRTRLAVQRIRHLLTDPETVAARVQHADDEELQATYRTAEGVFEAASAKLHWAYNQVLDAAEQMETPMRPYELGRPSMLAGAAEAALAGTRYQETVVDRARALDERWKADVAAVMQARQELYDRLAAEAAEAWPGIVAALGPREDFDPHEPGTHGRLVLLSGVHNRAGWDFDGRAYDFAMRLSGMPLGGAYEPHVLRALEHAWYELKLDVNDRIPWDVVAVVEGPDTIGQRTTVTLRDKDTNLEIGKLEEWPAVACVRLRVVALHAGPVAVGPTGD